MIPIALAVLCGTLCLQLSPVLPSPLVRGLLLVLALTLTCWPRTRLVTACLAGFIWAASVAGQRLAADLPAALEGHDLQVRGAIVSLPEVAGRSTRFLFALQATPAATDWQASSRIVRLSWYDAPPLHAGQGWQLNLRLKRRHGFHNPGGFDYAGWLLHNGITATGYVRLGNANRPRPSSNAADPLLSLRHAVDQRLQETLSGVSHGGLLRALTLGADDGIPAAQWDVFRATGTGHLVAISGMHISLVAGLAFATTRRLWSRSTWLTQWLAAPRAAAVAAMLLATLYSVLAGFGIPTRRAWLMVLVLLSGVVLGRPTHASHSLALALLCVIVFDPFAVLSPGFWLSFVAVAIIFVRLTPRRDPQRGLTTRVGRETQQLVRLQWALSLGLLPLTLLFFGQLGWVAPLANLMAVPWTTLLMMPLVFAGLLVLYPLPGLAQLLFAAAGWTAARMNEVLSLLASLPGTQVGMPNAPVWVSCAACVGAALLLLPRGAPHRYLGWLALVPLATWAPARPDTGTVWLTLLDVGQGLAAVVQTREHTLVFDAGPRFSTDFDTGAAVVAPFLSAYGIRRLDRLIISHGDNDHRGGAASLDARLPAFRVLTSVPARIEWRYATRCAAGQNWVWDDVQFQILHPNTDRHIADNNSSCVLQVEAANGDRLLLPGDIEAAAEQQLVSHYGESLRSDVLVAPHHGSRTSSTPAFIRAVAPKALLIPAGYRNRYGFPHPTVSSRYREFGTPQWRTGDFGALHVRLGDRATGLTVRTERQRDRRYWHLPTAVPPQR